MNFIETVQKIRNILQLDEMAQRQGNDEYFVYYTLDNEFASHRPHVHICVNKGDKHWKGKNFKNGQNLKTVASVYLPIEQIKRNIPFSLDNLEFEEVIDNKINSTKYKKSICNWLNSIEEDEIGITNTNAINSYRDYMKSNGDVNKNR